MVMSSSARILGHCVAFDHPDSNGSRQMARMLGASISRTYLDGDFVILRNHEEPIFRLPREGIDELFIETPALDNQALADLGNAWKFRSRSVLDARGYDVVLFLDVDCLVLRNLDHLFVGDDWDILVQPEPGRPIQDPVFHGYLTNEEMQNLSCSGVNAGTWAVNSWSLLRNACALQNGIL